MDQGAASHREQQPWSAARSVIVCAYTRARWDHLRAAVSEVGRQLAPGDELIVVVDHNPDLLEMAEQSFPNARVVSNSSARGLSGARNTGVAAACNEVVVFLDDDALPHPLWLDRITAPLLRSAVAGVGGLVVPDWEGGAAPAWFPDEFGWVVGCSYRGLPTRAGPIRNPTGASMALRSSHIAAVGGFAEALGRRGSNPMGGEETDIAIRIAAAGNGTMWFEPSAVVSHRVGGERLTLQYFLRRCFAEGMTKASIAHRSGTAAATSSERRHLVTLATGVVRRLGKAVRRPSVGPVLEAGAIVVGLSATAIGFVAGYLGDRSVR